MLMMIHHISLLNSYISVLICSSVEVIINEQDLLCLSIADITQLSQEKKQERLDSLKKLDEDIQRNLEEVFQKLRQLGVPVVEDTYSHYIRQRAEFQLIQLTRELEENTESQKAEELQKQIFFLHYYIYLWYEWYYTCEQKHLLDMWGINYFLLTKQAEYIRVIDIFKNYFYKYPNVIKTETHNFQKEQEKINKMYDAILATNKRNVEYIEKVCKHNAQECLSLTTSKIEELNNNKSMKDQLNWMHGLINDYNIRYIQNKIDKLLNILVPFNVITLEVEYNIYALHMILEQLVQEDTQDPIPKYILKYCRYLCAKYEYSFSFMEYLFHVPKPNQQSEAFELFKEELEAKLKQYNEVKGEFTEQLPDYLKLIQNNLLDKDLQQCKPKKEEIEDILNTMSESNKTLLIKLLETNKQLTPEEEKQLQDELRKLKAQQEKEDARLDEERKKQEQERKNKEIADKAKAEEDAKLKAKAEEDRLRQEQERKEKEEEEKKKKQEDLQISQNVNLSNNAVLLANKNNSQVLDQGSSSESSKKSAKSRSQSLNDHDDSVQPNSSHSDQKMQVKSSSDRGSHKDNKKRNSNERDRQHDENNSFIKPLQVTSNNKKRNSNERSPTVSSSSNKDGESLISPKIIIGVVIFLGLTLGLYIIFTYKNKLKVPQKQIQKK